MPASAAPPLLVLLLALAGCATAATSGAVAREPLLEPPAVPTGAQVVEVTRHVDGDTLRVRPVATGVLPEGREVVVRLLEIDAPETRAGPECFGERASAELARLLPVGSRAVVAPDRELRDRYGRHLGYVWNTDGVLVNEVMVWRGFATALLVEPNDRHIARMRRAEAAAREGEQGLWGACPELLPDHSGTRRD